MSEPDLETIAYPTQRMHVGNWRKVVNQWSLLSAGITVLCALPLVALIWQSFGDSKGVWPHLLAYVIPNALNTTLLLLAGVGFVTFFVGTICAWLISRYQFPFRNTLQWMLILPLAIPTYVSAYTWVEFADYTGPIQSLMRSATGFHSARDYWFPDIRSTGGAVFIIGFVLFPYVYLPARLSFRMQNASMLDVARLLGAKPIRLFFKVGLPAARPAIIIGIILTLMETLNDIGAVEYLGVRTLTFSIFDTWLNRSSLAGAAQLSLSLMVLVIGLVYLERYFRRHQSYHDNKNSTGSSELIQLPKKYGLGALLICFIPVLIGFVIPVYQLTNFTISQIDQLHNPVLLKAALNSMSVALFSAVICVISGFILVYSSRRSDWWFLKLNLQFSGFGYAIPGTILAIGVLTALTNFDNWLSQQLVLLFDYKSGLLFSGSMAIIIFACSVRFLAVAIGNIEAGYTKISPNTLLAARTLGRTEGQTLKEVEIPMISKAMGVAMLLVFVETTKELSATLLLRPFNFDTLATFVYSYATRAVFEEASFAALLIVMFGLIPVYFLTKVIISEHNR